VVVGLGFAVGVVVAAACTASALSWSSSSWSHYVKLCCEGSCLYWVCKKEVVWKYEDKVSLLFWLVLDCGCEGGIDGAEMGEMSKQGTGKKE